MTQDNNEKLLASGESTLKPVLRWTSAMTKLMDIAPEMKEWTLWCGEIRILSFASISVKDGVCKIGSDSVEIEGGLYVFPTFAPMFYFIELAVGPIEKAIPPERSRTAVEKCAYYEKYVRLGLETILRQLDLTCEFNVEVDKLTT